MLLLWITNHKWIYAFLFIYCANSISTKILPLKFCHSVSKSLSCLFRLDQVCSIKNELKNAIFLLTSPTNLSWRMCCLFWPANRNIACHLLIEIILFSYLTSFGRIFYSKGLQKNIIQLTTTAASPKFFISSVANILSSSSQNNFGSKPMKSFSQISFKQVPNRFKSDLNLVSSCCTKIQFSVS